MNTIEGFFLMLLLIYGLVIAVLYAIARDGKKKQSKLDKSTEKYFMEDQS